MRAATWISRLALVTLAAALLFGAIVVGVAPRIWGAAHGWQGTPVELPSLQPLARPTTVRDVDGNVIAVFQRQNSQPVKLGDIPQPVIDAFLAVEDEGFYQHNGVNARSLFRATLSNVASDSQQQGASTITMQVAKNEFLGGLERNLQYKILQIHYAMMLERQYTKDQILERYLNTVFFGNNAYGIQAAAETYFGTTVDQLTQIQAAFLAGLVRSPSGYDPIDNPERSRARFAQVIKRLEEVGIITTAEGDAQLNPDTGFEIPARVQSIVEGGTPPPRTYYTEALTDYLLNRPLDPALQAVLGDTPEERASAIYRGGLNITTTFDPNLQTLAENARNVLPDTPQGFDASIVSLDTQTGAIRAMVGGKGFVPGIREVNLALAPRQTGSSVKLFILAAALQAGVQADDVIDGRRPCVLPNPGDPDHPFEITDAVSRDVDTVRNMTVYSINCAYARLSQVVGLYRVVNMMYRMAQSPYLYLGQSESERTPIQPYASLATGANEMSALDMASGAQTIANHGLHMAPYYVEQITDHDGTVLYTHNDPGTQVLDPGVADAAVDIMKGVLTEGTARRHPLDGIPSAGKTGTQEDNTNAWFVGFTRHLTTAVWIGDPNGHQPMQNVPEFNDENRERVQGGLYPAQIWQTYMQPANQFLPIEDWSAPPPDRRAPARLFLPGNECLYQITGYSGGGPARRPGSPRPTRRRRRRPPSRRRPPAPPPAQPVQTVPVRPVYAQVDAGTTIPPNNLDANAPVPSVLLSQGLAVRGC